jgi:hypothetical protein
MNCLQNEAKERSTKKAVDIFLAMRWNEHEKTKKIKIKIKINMKRKIKSLRMSCSRQG